MSKADMIVNKPENYEKNRTKEILFLLLRGAITGTNEETDLCDADFVSLYSLAKFHDLAHICYYELERRGKLPEGDIGNKFREQYNIAIFRHVKRIMTIPIGEIRNIK